MNEGTLISELDLTSHFDNHIFDYAYRADDTRIEVDLYQYASIYIRSIVTNKNQRYSNQLIYYVLGVLDFSKYCTINLKEFFDEFKIMLDGFLSTDFDFNHLDSHLLNYVADSKFLQEFNEVILKDYKDIIFVSMKNHKFKKFT